jgi:hypothetical protein
MAGTAPPMTANERVQKFRRVLQDRHRKRFETCLDVTVIEEMTAVAEALHVSVWKVVENALATYINQYRTLAAERQRLCDEHIQIKQCASHSRIDTFHQDLAFHNERVSRFLQPRVGQTGQNVQA